MTTGLGPKQRAMGCPHPERRKTDTQHFTCTTRNCSNQCCRNAIFCCREAIHPTPAHFRYTPYPLVLLITTSMRVKTAMPITNVSPSVQLQCNVMLRAAALKVSNKVVGLVCLSTDAAANTSSENGVLGGTHLPREKQCEQNSAVRVHRRSRPLFTSYSYSMRSWGMT